MTAKGPEPGLRESELLRALAEQTAPRPVSWLLILGLVSVGGAALALLVNTVGVLQARPRVIREESVDPEALRAAIAAYKSADWDASERLFRSIHERFPGNVRSQDYLDRIALTRRDADALARAEEALVAGQPERALQLSERVAPNAPLFAQAEGLHRSALAQIATGPEHAGRTAGAPPVNIRPALGEALALYEAGEFGEAMQRAQGLAKRAADSARDDLLSWASDVATFGKLYPQMRTIVEASGPEADQDVLASLTALQQAVELDERLSEGHYARGLRTRAAQALTKRATTLSQNGQLVDACSDLVKAYYFAGRTLTPREGSNLGLERRCEGEALRRVNQARALERRRPVTKNETRQADPAIKALYEQALALAIPGSPAFGAAQQALAR